VEENGGKEKREEKGEEGFKLNKFKNTSLKPFLFVS
jgi:hypothetical protein